MTHVYGPVKLAVVGAVVCGVIAAMGFYSATARTGSISQAAPRYSSVCVRNMQKIDNTMVSSGLLQFAASNDRWLIQVNELVAQLYQPCAAYDPSAAQQQQRASQEASRIRTYCSQSRPAHDCTPWGYGEQAENRNWFNRWEREVRLALSDPNYSADLGPAAGPGGGASSPVASASVGPTSDLRCTEEMQNLGAQMRADEARLGSDATVARLELILWYVDSSLQAIDRLCPQSSNYATQRDSFRQTQREVTAACNAISTRTCSARRPR